MNESFFIQPETSEKAILLIDASGSVIYNAFDQKKCTRVFEKMQEVCCALPHQEYRVVFWNSDNPKAKNFEKSGVFKVPVAVKTERLPHWFEIVKKDIEGNCLTMPHLAFSQIDDWLEKYSRCIYFVTDGFMGWPDISRNEQQQLNAKFVAAIKNLVEKYRDAQLSILAVECEPSTNYNVIESTSKVVGNDVYKAISDNKSTNLIAKFVSFTPVHHIDGYAHIDRVQVPKGMIPFGRRYFSPLSVPDFMLYVSKLVFNNKNDDNALLKIVQDLSATLVALTNDKPASIRAKIVELFCNMFENTSIDAATAQFLLLRGIQSEESGSAQLHAEYRAGMKQLFANAGKALRDNAAQAMLIYDSCLTLPLRLNSSNDASVVLVSDSCEVTERICDHERGGILIDSNKKSIPIVPFISTQCGLMPNQCTRQWLRLLLSKQFKIDSSSDEMIFVMLGINLQAQITRLTTPTPLSERICAAYVNLVSVMLGKKRLNSQKTEMEQLLAGNLFVSNDGNVERFGMFLKNVAHQLGLVGIEPLRLWYFLCLAHSEALATSQRVYCEKHLISGETMADFAKAYGSAIPKLFFHQLPDELDFVCLITMDSTAESGGFKFARHNTAMGSTCCPRQVLSAAGLEQLLATNATSLCPVCYTSLKKSDFVAQGPKTSNKDENAVFSFSDIDVGVFKSTDGSKGTVFAPPAPLSSATASFSSFSSSATATATSSSSCSSATSSSSTYSSIASSGSWPTPGILVVLKGTVGCGKSTYAKKFQMIAESAGKQCFVEGSDKYVMQGFGFGAPAAAQVKDALQKAIASTEKNKIVVIDGCNEKFQKNNVYGVDFSKWRIETVWVNCDRKQLKLYLAWSLRNVLRRGRDDSVLTPGKLGYATCLEVHTKKARSLFGKQVPDVAGSSFSVEDTLNFLKKDAEAYDCYLEEHKDEFEPKLF